MTHEFRNAEACTHSPEVPFRIVTLYDSPLSSAEAARASALVMRELGEEIPVDRCSWNIQSLNDGVTRQFAAAEAARADLILIALSLVTPSQALKDWINRWEKHRQLSGGLLALIPSGTQGQAANLEAYLYETAITANMDFLCRKDRRY